jgi:hypothetical protein
MIDLIIRTLIQIPILSLMHYGYIWADIVVICRLSRKFTGFFTF